MPPPPPPPPIAAFHNAAPFLAPQSIAMRTCRIRKLSLACGKLWTESCRRCRRSCVASPITET